MVLQALDNKHFYEVIPRHKPCKLYFDLEFEKIYNGGKEGHHMTELLIILVNKKLQEKYSCSSFREDVLVLESSNERKFSIHLIFTKSIFANNEACGFFVKDLIINFSEEEKEMFLIHNSDGSPGNFIDTSVYSKNRNFRLFLAKKFGKPTPFTLSPIDLFSLRILENQSSNDNFLKQIFKYSLITNVEKEANIIQIKNTLFQSQGYSNKITYEKKKEISSRIPSSPFLEIDQFISKLVFPGRIR